MSIKVIKFGGSSLADANQFKKVKDIILADKDRRYVVPSAPGKRFSSDIKVTDMLYSCYDVVAKGGNFDSAFAAIKARYEEIIKDLSLSLSLEEEFLKIKSAFVANSGKDYAASRGEYLNGIILAKFLGYTFVDAAELIFFKENGSLDSEKTYRMIKEKLLPLSNAVIPGFYGAMPNDTIKTFSRGGSDITGAIVARGVNAILYENFTDVSGFLVSDPRIVNNPDVIDVITYKELRELSYMGATVLHEDSVFPVRTAGIPINIKNTNAPEHKGTMIVPAKDKSSNIVTGIAGKKGFSVIIIEKDMMNAELGFGRRTLGVLESLGISFEHLPSGIDTMSIVVASKDIEGKEEQLISLINESVNPDSISIDTSLALIAVVGIGMKATKGTAARIFNAISKADINIRMIDQGSSEINIIMGVDECDFENAIRTIYDEFFK